MTNPSFANIFKIAFVIVSILNVSLLALIYYYINNINAKCECSRIDKNMTTYFNTYIYIMLLLLCINIIYIMTGNFQQLLNSPLIFAIKAFSMVTYVLLLKYIYDIQTKCKCNHIEPNIRKFLYVWCWIVIISTVIELLASGMNRKQKVNEIIQQHSNPLIIIPVETLSKPKSKSKSKSKSKRLSFKGKKIKRTKK
jgi:hypothetical protein